MKGYRFYKEYDSPQDKRKNKPNGNVFARYTDNDSTWLGGISGSVIMTEGFGAAYFDANSPCVFSTASVDWLRENCKRISEAEARKIHPALFARIEE